MYVVTYLLARRRLAAALVLAGGVIAMACAALNAGVNRAGLRTATATTHVLIDTPAPSLLYRQMDVQSLVRRGEILGRVLASPVGLDLTAERAQVPASELTGVARTVGDVPTALTDPGLEQRAAEIAASRAPYRLEAQARPNTPVLDIYTQAPTAAEAERLGNAAVQALGAYLDQLGAREGVPKSQLLVLKQLGPARGMAVGSKAPLMIGTLTFMFVFAVYVTAVLLAVWLRLRKSHATDVEPTSPVPTDNWPHTSRVMPWMLAGFIAMLWLVPFNQIKLAASAPIDLYLDRLVLPVVFVMWVFAMAVGSGEPVRIRLTWIHGMIAIFAGIALLSVVLDARYITHILELDLAIKQLPLLFGYLSLFLIASTVIRAAEVRAYLNFTLVLAVVCGLGMVYEYRIGTNPFYDIADKILPGAFIVESANDGVLDSLGRTEVHGPAQPGVEAVTMLSMALPIAIVGFMQARERRDRVLYAIAASVLVAATFATFRKSALVAPISVGLALAFFRRRELLKLAPLGLVLGIVVSALAPGALRTILNQFLRADAASVPTTSDRTADYDAIRPDLWTHLAFGRGWGTYNHQSYRILDSEVLHRLVDVGVFGLLAFVGIGVSVVMVARKTIRERDPDWAPSALIGACAAVCFTCASSLYDSLSFPHATYIFFYMAALVAVVARRPKQQRRPLDLPPTRVRHVTHAVTHQGEAVARAS